MKIYNEIRIDMTTGETLSEDSFEYRGPVSECKGGGQTTTTVDPEYNAGMLELSRENQQWANKLMNNYFYGTDYNPEESVYGFYGADGKFVEMPDYGSTVKGAATAGRYLNPFDGNWVEGATAGSLLSASGATYNAKTQQWTTADGKPVEVVSKTRGELYGFDPGANVSGKDYAQRAINAQASLLPGETAAAASETALKGEAAEAARTLLPQQTAVNAALYNSALNGVNVNDRVNTAAADVAASFSNADAEYRMDLARMGINPSSGRGSSTTALLGKATAMGAAKTGARQQAEAESFSRLQNARS